MDRILQGLASYASELRYEDIPPEVRHAAKRAIIDALGCAIGAYDSEPARIGRELAEATRVERGSTVIGSLQRTTPELAAFCNGAMIRHLDYNDNYWGPGGGGHPSDFLAAVLSSAELGHADGRGLITGLVVTYELFCRMVDEAMLATTAWDYYITIGALASAAGAAKVLDLQVDGIANAISLGIVANCALFETRVGDISTWKAGASGNAARNGVFAARVAAAGGTGPSHVFDGRKGFDAAFGRQIRLPNLGGAERGFAILECSIKRYPCGSFSQTAVDAAFQLRSAIGPINEIVSVEVGTHTIAKMVMGDPEKWHPTSRETADHSLPYVVGIALLNGEVTIESFTKYLDDQRLAALMPKISVVVDDESERALPELSASRITIDTRSHGTHEVSVLYHLGHPRNPISDEDLEKKFVDQASTRLGPKQTRRLLDLLWRLEDVGDVADIVANTRV